MFRLRREDRRIGQRGSQTETMRDMIVLHYPFARRVRCGSVRACSRHRARVIMPKRSRAAGAVPTRQRVAAALASRVSAGRSRNSGTPAIVAASCSRWLNFRSSLSMMPATAAGARECSASSMSPQRFLAMRRLHQDQTARIETERIEAMTVRPAVMRSRKMAGRKKDSSRGGRREEDAGQHRRDEAEGGGDGAPAGHDLMQGAVGEAALRHSRMIVARSKGRGLVF